MMAAFGQMDCGPANLPFSGGIAVHVSTLIISEVFDQDGLHTPCALSCRLKASTSQGETQCIEVKKVGLQMRA